MVLNTIFVEFAMPTVRHWFSLLAPFLVLFSLTSWAEDEVADGSLASFNGKTIRTITITIADIFDDPDLATPYRMVNDLKISTHTEVVRRELLFSEGDTFDDFVIRESERNLRNLGFFRQVSISPTASEDQVDLVVKVQDTWTIIPQFAFSSGTGRQRFAAGLAESNLLGLGKLVEVGYEEDTKRQSYQALYNDNRLWGTYNKLVAAAFDRNDGSQYFLSLSKPFRSFVDPDAWVTEADVSDTIGRLFANGDERYIYRQRHNEFGARYTLAHGDPKVSVGRYTLGYRYEHDGFTEAEADDFDDLDLDPDLVSRDPELLAESRRYSGFTFGYDQISPQFISMNYIDRFERVADYNLGHRLSLLGFVAPEVMGSRSDTVIFSGNAGVGHQFSKGSFWRGEIGGASRLDDHGLANSLLRTEMKYFYLVGLVEAGNFSLGRHTLATNLAIDYGIDLDLDRELLLGGDNGLRGYQARTFTGDKRLVLNLEDRVHLIDDAFKIVSVGMAAFVDAGGSTDERFTELFGQHFYSDVGVGLRFAFPRSTGGGVFRIDLALPLRDGPEGSGAFEPRLIFSGGQLFSSFLRSETDGSERASGGIGFDR